MIFYVRTYMYTEYIPRNICTYICI